MPGKKDNNQNNITAGDNSLVINGDVSNTTIIIGDNSRLTPSSSLTKTESSSASAVPVIVGSESPRSMLIPFLCYSKENSTDVRGFREQLKAETWIDPWFDEEDILPGEKWEGSVADAVHNSHAVIIFLSSIAVRTEGFFHVELKLALDAAAENQMAQSSSSQFVLMIVMFQPVYSHTNMLITLAMWNKKNASTPA